MKWFMLLLTAMAARTAAAQEQCRVYVGDSPTAIDDWTETSKEILLETFSQNTQTISQTLRLENLIFKELHQSASCTDEYFHATFATDTSILSFEPRDFDQLDAYILSRGNNDITTDFSCSFYIMFEDNTCLNNAGKPPGMLPVRFVIQDYNDFDPKLSQTDFNFKVTSPIANGVSIPFLSQADMSVTDGDFSTSNFKLTVQDKNDDLEVKIIKDEDAKFRLDFYPTKLWYLEEPLTLAMTVTDDGIDPGTRSTSITITLTPDEKSTPPPPDFSQNYFEGDIDVQDLTPGNPVKGLTITFQKEYADGYLELSFGSATEYEKYFQPSYSGKDVTITLVQELGEDVWSQEVLVLGLTATVKNSQQVISSTAVIFTFTNVPTTTEHATTSTDASTPTETGPTETGPTETPPVDTTPSPGDDDNDGDSTDEENDSLLIATIVLGVMLAIALLALIVVYFKYVRGRHVRHGTSRPFDSGVSPGRTSPITFQNPIIKTDQDEIYARPIDSIVEKDVEAAEVEAEADENPKGLESLIAEHQNDKLLKPQEMKTRKRSMTFSESDDESRQHRESADESVRPRTDDVKPEPTRKKSVVFSGVDRFAT